MAKPLSPLLSSKPAPPGATTAAAPPGDAMFGFLDDCHREMQRQLGLLTALARDIETDGLTPVVRARVREVQTWFNVQAREHHLDEEHNVFPALLASADDEVVQAARRLTQDHAWLETDWMEIEPSLAAAADGYTWFDPAVLRYAVEVFQQLYLDHIVLEETLAYPAARSAIPQAEIAAMGVEMARRRALRESRTVRRS